MRHPISLDALIATSDENIPRLLFQQRDGLPQLADDLKRILLVFNSVLHNKYDLDSLIEIAKTGEAQTVAIKTKLTQSLEQSTIPHEDDAMRPHTLAILTRLDELVKPISAKICGRVAPEQGKTGEQFARETINTYFPTVDVAPAAFHCGDIAFTDLETHLRYMIEVKFYSRAVSTDEVEKFTKDATDSKFDVAILVAYNQPIAKHTRLHYETIGPKQLHIYVPSADIAGTALAYAITFGMCYHKIRMQYASAPEPIGQPIASTDIVMSHPIVQQMRTEIDRMYTVSAHLDRVSNMIQESAAQMISDVQTELNLARFTIMELVKKYGSPNVTLLPVEAQGFKCIQCGRMCASQGGLKNHMRACTKTPPTSVRIAEPVVQLFVT